MALELIKQPTNKVKSEILVGEVVALKGVNTCAAICTHVCTAISSCPGMFDAIRALVDVSAAGACSIAVGLINCLKRCKEVQMVLLHVGCLCMRGFSRFLEALLPVVRNVGVGYNFTATPSAFWQKK